jgi:putative SOS response-associated peptidase YedK
MCGRYYRRSDKQRIAEGFSVGKLPEGFVLPDWDYNVAPTTFQPVIRHNKQTAEREGSGANSGMRDRVVFQGAENGSEQAK